jgi:hypothetical protein
MNTGQLLKTFTDETVTEPEQLIHSFAVQNKKIVGLGLDRKKVWSFYLT